MEKIRLNKQFYDYGCINIAKIKYGKFLDIIIKQDENYFELKYTNLTETPNIINEFTNYVLALMKNKVLI